MTEPQTREFDLEAVYDNEISPLMTQIIAICKAHKLPMFATFLYGHGEGEGEGDFCTTYLPFEGRAMPQGMAALLPMIEGPRISPLRMRTTGGDGSIVETVVL